MTLMHANTELQSLIRQKLNEDLNTDDSYLQAIKEWLLQQPHLPDTWDDVPLLNFLRGCSFSLEKSKTKLDKFFTLRTAIPEFFLNRNLKNPELIQISKEVNICTLPNLTKKGHRVVILRYRYKNIFSSMEASMKLQLMIHELRLVLEETGIAGDVCILDGETITAHHFKKFTPTAIKKFFLSIFDVYPLKVKEIHIINTHSFVNVVYTWIKPFLKPKIKQRIHFHPDGIESLYKFVPKEILPEEYGGNAGKLQDIHDSWMSKLEEYEQWFKEQENFKSDESKRLGDLHNHGDIFGVAGSFKQLNVD